MANWIFRVLKMYEPVIGLEVHVHLKTKTKIFCGCSTAYGSEPNSQVCPVCLGFPGALPVLNRTAFLSAVKVGIALNCTVNQYTKFDRKHYFYPDLPKNYQISQYDLPVSADGYLDVEVQAQSRRIRVKRAHLEEDAGKLIHKPEFSLVDYNRAGMPLLEIVTEPDITSPEEAYEYLAALKSIIEYLGVSDCDMEKGSLRCDANVSVRPRGMSGLGVKTEVKNMNSFKGVRDALDYEINRQIAALKQGEAVIQETRLWDPDALKTVSMRSKEEAKDYRYFPEPDLPPCTITEAAIAELKAGIPELPQKKLRRFMTEYGLSASDAKILIAVKPDADYAEECFRGYSGADKKNVCNWLIGPLACEANSRGCRISVLGLSAAALVELLGFVESGQVSYLSGKSVLTEMLAGGKTAAQIIREKNLAQISDTDSLKLNIAEVIREQPKTVQDVRQGKVNGIMFLVGQVMKKTNGKANPKIVQELIKEALKSAE